MIATRVGPLLEGGVVPTQFDHLAEDIAAAGLRLTADDLAELAG